MKITEPSVWSTIQAKSYWTFFHQWLKPHLHRILSQEEAGFQEHRSTVGQIFTLWQLVEKHAERQNKRIAQAFIDYKKVFDCVWHTALFQVLDHYSIPTKLHNYIANLYNRTVSAVKCSGHVGEWCRTTVGSRQGCILSPDLFNIYIWKHHVTSTGQDNWSGCTSWWSSIQQPSIYWWYCFAGRVSRWFATPVRLSQLSKPCKWHGDKWTKKTNYVYK